MKTNSSISVRWFTFLPLLGLAAGAGLFACSGEFKAECPEGTVQNGGGDVGEACVAAGAGGAGGTPGEGGQGGSAGGQGGQAGQGGGVSGTGGGGDGTITVRGSVVRRNDGKAFAGATLWINGQPVVTDAEGQFEVANVAAPYQLAYRQAAGVNSYEGFSFYEGLSSPDLSLRLQSVPESQLKASITGTLTGAGMHPQPAGYFTNLVAVGEDGRRVGSRYVSHFNTGPSSEFKVDLQWPHTRGNRINVKLYAVQGKNGADGTSLEAYTGYGFSAMSVTANEILAAQSLPLTEPPQRAVELNVVAPGPGFELSAGDIHFRPAGPSTEPLLLFDTRALVLGPSRGSFLTPDVAGGSTDFAVHLSGPDYQISTQFVRGAADVASGLTVAPPLPVKIAAPADQVALDYGQTMTWSPVEGAVHRVWMFNNLDGFPEVNLYTTSTTVTLPNLAAFGFSAPTKQFGMFVSSFGPYASTDAYLAEVAKGEEAYVFRTQSSGRSVTLP